MKIDHILEAKRKLFKYEVLEDNKIIGSTEGYSWNNAQQNAEKQFPDNQVTISLIKDDATMKYLTKLSMSRAKDGEDAYSIAAPFTKVMFWKDPRDTHYMNIANMLPGPVKISFLKELGAENEINNMSPYEKLDYFPGDLLKKYPESDRTPEVYEQIFTKLLASASRSKLVGEDDLESILDMMFEKIPQDKWSKNLISVVQRTIINNEYLLYEIYNYPDSVPKYIVSVPFIINSIKKYPDMVFAWSDVVTPDIVNMAFKLCLKSNQEFTGRATDSGIDEAATYFSDEVLRDPTFRKLLHLYKQKFPEGVDTDEKNVDVTYEGRPDPRIKADDQVNDRTKNKPTLPQSEPATQTEPSQTEPTIDTKINESIDRIKKLSGL